MKIAITGGSGQLGTLVLRRLIVDKTVKEVVTIDLRPPVVASAKIRMIRADIREDNFAQYLKDCEVLVHLAFVVTRYLPRGEFDAINIDGSKNVFRAAAAAGVRHIVYASSIAAYGTMPGHPVPIVETTPRRYHHSMPYAAAKYRLEEFLDEFEQEHPNIVVTRFRPAILLGVYMEHPFGQTLRRRRILDRGDTPIPIVWDEDVAEAILLAIRSKAQGAFNLAADNSLPAAELAQIGGLRLLRVPGWILLPIAYMAIFLAKLGIGRDMDPAWLKEAKGEMIISNAKARQELGWQPRCQTAAEVIKKYVEIVPRRLDPRLARFFCIAGWVSRFQRPSPAQQQVSARIHLALAGPTGGDLGCFINHGRLSIANSIPRPPTAVARLSASTLLDLLAGRTDFAAAQITGKIHFEGEPTGAMFLNALITNFRTNTTLPGLRGWLARRLTQNMGESQLKS
ncbi:hydroxysteroid dehydrogenase-like protein 2 [candidate division KSB1 bacterium]|nr:hydroxysteroid dehydrogenase-like protein 2 [candidate division KSB1 bacterium]